MTAQDQPRRADQTDRRAGRLGWRSRAVGTGLVLVPLSAVAGGVAFAGSSQAPPLNEPTHIATVSAAYRPGPGCSPAPERPHHPRPGHHAGKDNAGKDKAGKGKADKDKAALKAFFGAGYDYDDAVVLAELWNSPSPFDAKVAAGRKVSAGEELPIAPGGALPSSQQQEEAVRQAAIDAYFAAGYDYDDALVLATYWNSESAFDAKVRAGGKLVAGVDLPIVPGGTLTQAQHDEAAQAAALDAFFGAGYDYDDAVALAALWSSSDPFEAKVTAGEKILAGLALPLQPNL